MRADREAGRRVQRPVLFVASERDDIDLHGDPVEIWRSWCTDLRSATVDSDHHVAEENPEALTDVLRRFLMARVETSR